MLKRLAYLGLAAAVLLGLFFGRDAVDYVRTFTTTVQEQVRDSVPITFEIKRAEDMIANLDKPIKDTTKSIIREGVEVDRLTERVDGMRTDLAKAKRQILRLNDDLRSSDTEFVYGDQIFTAAQVKSDLSARFDRFKTQEKTLSSLEKTLSHRQRGLEAAKNKLNSMVDAQKDLEADLALLKARQSEVEQKEAASNFADSISNSELARTRDVMQNISDRITVAEKMLDSGSMIYEIPLDDDGQDLSEISDQVTDYFGDRRAEVESLVSSEK